MGIKLDQTFSFDPDSLRQALAKLNERPIPEDEPSSNARLAKLYTRQLNRQIDALAPHAAYAIERLKRLPRAGRGRPAGVKVDGKKLKWIRHTMLKLSQQTLAEKCGLDLVSIQRAERKEQTIDFETVETIVATLNRLAESKKITLSITPGHLMLL